MNSPHRNEGYHYRCVAKDEGRGGGGGPPWSSVSSRRTLACASPPCCDVAELPKNKFEWNTNSMGENKAAQAKFRKLLGYNCWHGRHAIAFWFELPLEPNVANVLLAHARHLGRQA
ncbi:hypothetical protein M569_17687 [Genlisea aurea]|uniref:Uncharacterized protein n=1 Tax=Genlisea aurea TaxID=192259 RepID=S8BR79_9LAMI|nr:hypothetical protein M569_17687 [Genlisea aurea]